MRLLIISSEFPPGPGGIGTHAYQIARELQRNGCEVLVITPQDYADENEIAKFNFEQAFETFRLTHKKSTVCEAFYRGFKANTLIRSWSPDIMLASGSASVWLIAFLSNIHHIPWVAVGHGTEFALPLKRERILTRWSFNQADWVICVSQFTRKVMYELGIRPKCASVISNGADNEIFHKNSNNIRQTVLNEIGVNDNSTLLLTVGNVTNRKGQEVVIRALPMVLNEFPQTEYLLAGLPTEKTQLERLAIDLNVRNHIHFLGRRSQEQIVQLYQACDIFLMTSRKLPNGDFEGFGISVIEAALCGKPAIVSKGSGLEEAIVDGVTGISVPENDPLKTAEAIIELLLNPSRKHEMGKEALQRALNGYTWKFVGQKYLGILRQCISGHRDK